MKRSIFSKVFSGYILTVVLLSIFILLFSFRMIRNHYIETLTESLKKLGLVLSTEVIPFLEKNRINELDDFTKRIGSRIHTRITIVSPEGSVWADSEEDPRKMEQHDNRPEIRQAIEEDFGTFLRYSTTLKEDVLYIAVSLKKNDSLLGVLRTSILLNNINSLLTSLKKDMLLVVVFIVLISFIGAFIFSKSLTRPIRELSAASRKVAEGDFDTKVFLSNKDEVKELADSFNAMGEEIKTLFGKLSHQKERLDSMISSLQEGFLLLDKDDRFVLSNESFKRIAKNTSIEGKFYWEVIRDIQFANLIKGVRERRKNVAEEVKLDNRIYLSSATFMEAKEEIVVILHNITQMKKLDKIKKDFAINVSHELRTPLTAIKGFAETLDGLVDDEEQQYVEIIKRNTDRLINIVRDLLLLSELEENGVGIVIEKVDVREVIENVVKIFDEPVKEKGIELTVNIGKTVQPIKADPFKLEQMFINLIDNAIKYTEEGQIKIMVTKEENRVAITIEDTGIGIPQEDQSRIFERFYVVDKSRSRKSGGTGLGLSIVKHIVLLHNGTISVESTPASGTTFTIFLPIN